MIVRTFEGLQALTTPSRPAGVSASAPSLRLFDSSAAYSEVYRRQPNVRIPIDFLSRNVAHLAPQVFRRVSDTDRVRLADHQLAQWLKHPNPAMTGYRLIETLMGDLGVYFEAFLLKIRYQDAAGRAQIGLVGLPPEQMGVDGGLLPTSFIWTAANGRPREFAPSEIVYFNGYNPCDRLRGLSLFETLRSVLAEEAAAVGHREAFWRNTSKQEGVWEIAKDAPAAKWNTEQTQSWREQWQAFASGAKAGMTALGPAGGTYKPTSFSPKDAEFTAGSKLRREVTTAGYHTPQPMVGILDHATFSNIREQHKNLYQDTVGPTLEMLTQEFERQLLIECEDQTDIYLEFNIDAKLAGSFEEQATALQIAVGKPYMKVNEARAIRNLPRDEDPASDRIAPQQGGPSDASANPNNPPTDPTATRQAPNDGTDDTSAAAIAPVLQAAQRRQETRLAKVHAYDRAAFFFDQLSRWNRELAEDLTPILGAEAAATRARAVNQATLDRLLALEAA